MTPQMTEDPMEVVQKRAVDICFPDEPVRSLVLQVLKEAKEHLKNEEMRTVDRLEILAIKLIMEKTMYHTVYGRVLYSLVFGEYLDICDFGRDGPFSDHFLNVPGLKGDPVAIFTDLRRDPHIMLAVWQHIVSAKNVIVQVGRFSLEIILGDEKVTSIPHPRDSPFDTFWAKQFIRLMLLNSARRVEVEYFDPYWTGDPAVMFNTIEGMIANLEPKIPAEGWEKAIGTGKRAVYEKLGGFSFIRTYSLTFFLSREYDSSCDYWGYLE